MVPRFFVCNLINSNSKSEELIVVVSEYQFIKYHYMRYNSR